MREESSLFKFETYQSILRFIAKKRVLQDPFLPIRNSSNFEPVTNEHDEASEITGLIKRGTEDQPLRLNKARFIDSFFNGFYFSVNTILPLLLILMWLHDFIYFSRTTNNKYGDTNAKILLGLSDDPNIWSSNSGIAIFASILIFGLSNYVKGILQDYYYNLNTYNKVKNALRGEQSRFLLQLHLGRFSSALNKAKLLVLSDDRLDERSRDNLINSIVENTEDKTWDVKIRAIEILTDIANYRNLSEDNLLDNEAEIGSSLLMRWYANYKLWTIGQNKDVKYHAAFWLSLIIPAIYAVTSYSKFYFFPVVLVRNFINLFHHHSSPINTVCSNTSEASQYLPELGETVCSMCGNWPFVYINDINTTQGCVNGLLAAPRTPALIMSSLNHLLSLGNSSNLHTIDFSQQNWTAWNRPEWQSILNQFALLTNQVDILNLSTPALTLPYVDDGKLIDLANFTHNVIVNQLDFRNLGVGFDLVTSFFRRAYLAVIKYINVSSNNLNADGFGNLCSSLPNSVKILKVGSNNITDAGMANAAPFLANSSIEELDVSDNLISQQISSGIASIVKRGALQKLYVAGNDLTGVDLGPFWNATTENSALRLIDFSETNMANYQLTAAVPYLNQSSIEIYNLQNNPLDDNGVTIFSFNLKYSNATKINLSYTEITDYTTDTLSTVIPQSPLTTLILNGISITDDGLEALLDAAPNSNLQHISLQNNYLDDNSAVIIANVLKNTTNSLKIIDLTSNNEISDVGGGALAKASANSTLEEIYLDNNNQITSITVNAFAANLKNSSLKVFSAASCNIDDNGAIALANAIDGSNLKVLNLANNPLGNGTSVLALKLITATPYPNQLSEYVLSNDEAQALRMAKPASKLEKLILDNTGINLPIAREICRTLPGANFSSNRFGLFGNQFSSEEVNPLNCRFNQTQFALYRLQTNSELSQNSVYLSLSSNSYNINSSGVAFGISSIFLFIPVALVSMLAIYVIYLGISFTANKLAAKKFGIFSDADKTEESTKIFDGEKIKGSEDKQIYYRKL